MTSNRVLFSIALLSAVTAGVAPACAQQVQRAGQFRLQLSVIQNAISVAEPLRLLMEATAEGEPFTGAVLLAPLCAGAE